MNPAIPRDQHDVPLARFATLVLGLDLSFHKYEYRPVVASGFDREHGGVESRQGTRAGDDGSILEKE
jgi:hypothetical protein